MLGRYDEPSEVYVETREEEPPSQEELMDANDTLVANLREAERLAWELASAVIQAATLADAKQAASKYLGFGRLNEQRAGSAVTDPGS